MGMLRGVRCSTIFVFVTMLATFVVGASALGLTANAADSRQLASAHQALQAGNYAAAIKAVNAAFEAGGLTSEQTSRGLYIRGTAQLARKRSAEAIADLNAALWTGHLPKRLDTRAMQQRANAYAAAGIRTPPPVARRGTATRKSWAAVSKPITTGTLANRKARPSHKVAMPVPRVDRLPEGFKAPTRAVVRPTRPNGWSTHKAQSNRATSSPTLSRPVSATRWQAATHKPAQHNVSSRPTAPANVTTRSWSQATRAPVRSTTRQYRPAPRPPKSTVRRRLSAVQANDAARDQSAEPGRAPASAFATRTSRAKTVPQPVVRRPPTNFATSTQITRTAQPVRQAPASRKIVAASPPPSRSDTAASPPAGPASVPNLGTLFGGLLGTSGSEKPDHISAADELQRQRTQRIREHNRNLGSKAGPTGDAASVSQ